MLNTAQTTIASKTKPTPNALIALHTLLPAFLASHSIHTPHPNITNMIVMGLNRNHASLFT